MSCCLGLASCSLSYRNRQFRELANRLHVFPMWLLRPGSRRHTGSICPAAEVLRGIIRMGGVGHPLKRVEKLELLRVAEELEASELRQSDFAQRWNCA